jgi:hypothetical protein
MNFAALSIDIAGLCWQISLDTLHVASSMPQESVVSGQLSDLPSFALHNLQTPVDLAFRWPLLPFHQC